MVNAAAPHHRRGRRRVDLLACAAAIAIAIACGGQAVIDQPAGEAGASSVAGASSAGSAGVATNPACTAPQDPGPCDAYIPSFWHNPNTGLCEPFVYGGCNGNANRYPSRDACLQACPQGKDDWGECSNDSNCTQVSATCCEPCEPVAMAQLVAINVTHLPLYGNSHCNGSYACAPCMPVSADARTAKYFKPVCQNSRCTLVDIR